MDDRDMYYNSYGFGGFTPNTTPSNYPNMMNNMIPNQGYMPNNNQIPTNTYASSQFNDINERVSRLERQVKRLDQRLTRLETPYANNINQEPDNNMYIM